MAYISKRKTLYAGVFLTIAILCAGIALFVVFVMPKHAKITFDGNVLEAIEVKKGDVLPELETPSKYGYYFDNWYYSKDYNERYLVKPGIDIINGDTVLYAHFLPGTFTVSFDANGGEGSISSITGLYDSTFMFPDDDDRLVKDDLELKGWALTNTATRYEFELNSEGKITGEDRTYYAVWGEPMSTIKFVTGLGVGHMADQTYVRGSNVPSDALVAPPTSLVGHSFGGWYWDEEYTKPITSADTLNKKIEHFYAKWEPYIYTVTFYVNGRQYGNTQTIKFGEKITKPDDPTPETGKLFLGWFVDETLLSQYDFNKTVSGEDKNKSLYAKFGDIPTPTDETPVDALKLTEYNNGYMIIGLEDSYADITSLVIPRQYNGKNIIAIGSAFGNYGRSLAEIAFPYTIQEVQNGALSGCVSLASFRFLNGSEYLNIVDNVLFGKDSDTDIQFSKLICYPAKRVGDTYATPSYTKAVANRAFSNLSNLTTLTIDAESIGENAFTGSASLTSVTFSNRVTTIQDTAFINCDNLTEIISNSAHYTVENKVLYDSAKTKLIKYFNDTVDYDFVAPDSVTTIAQRAFGNAKLRSATFGINCTVVNNNVFAQCTNLTTVTFKANSISTPQTVNSMFLGATKINKIYLNMSESNALYTALRNTYADKIEQVTE